MRGLPDLPLSPRIPIFKRSLLYGPPPRLVWLRIGNCTRADLLSLLTTHESDIRAFDTDPNESVLVLT
jgi:predicted nuclease of predicted toxin-antitoxin system